MRCYLFQISSKVKSSKIKMQINVVQKHVLFLTTFYDDAYAQEGYKLSHKAKQHSDIHQQLCMFLTHEKCKWGVCVSVCVSMLVLAL